MSKLEKGLKEWASIGLISEEQATRILDYEKRKPENAWVLTGLLILGAVIIGIGLISLIAANWSQIPDAIKIVGNFSLLGILGFFTYRSWVSSKPIQFEILLLFYALHCLATIGLTSQVYHSDGKLYEALFFWAILTSAAAIASQLIFLPFIWTGAFLSGLSLYSVQSHDLRVFFEHNYMPIFLTIPFLCAALTTFAKRLSGEVGATRAFRYWMLLSGVMALIVSEAHQYFHDKGLLSVTPYIPSYLLAGLTAWNIWSSTEYRRFQKGLLLITITLVLIQFHLPIWEFSHTFVYAGNTVLILFLIAVFVASIHYRRLFQWLLILLGLRFLFLYFQALGGLALTGFGLIFSGLIIIGMAALWNKYRVAVTSWVERWAQ